MKTSVVIRFVIVGLLWALCCGVLIARMIAVGTPINIITVFPIVASGICIFVPLYKKYIRNDKQRKSNGK